MTDENISENDNGYQNYEDLIGSSSLDNNVTDKIISLNDDVNKNLNITDTPCICGKNTYNGTLPKTFNVSICGVCDGWF